MTGQRRILHHYRTSLKRTDETEERPYRVFLDDERRTKGLWFTQAFLDGVDELIRSVDQSSIEAIALAPDMRRCIDDVRQHGLDAPFRCHCWFERIATWHKLWCV